MGETVSEAELSKKAAQQGYEKLREIQGHYAKLRPELEGDKFWRYQRQVSPGLQEYIEALSFAHYLDHGSLITYEEVQRTLMDPHGVEVIHDSLLVIYTSLNYGSTFPFLSPTICLGFQI